MVVNPVNNIKYISVSIAVIVLSILAFFVFKKDVKIIQDLSKQKKRLKDAIKKNKKIIKDNDKFLSDNPDLPKL